VNPTIENVVNLRRYPYVCPFSMRVHTSFGNVLIARGFLSDGDSGVPDLCQEAFFAHDKLYIHPVVERKGNVIRISKFKCDIVYGEILMRRYRWFHAVIRPIGLTILGKTHQIWNDYRVRESANACWWVEPGPESHMVPLAADWEFPSFYTRDAVWKGAA